jgi:OPA family glycerol-3-phosphate transporter-like MFS transporter
VNPTNVFGARGEQARPDSPWELLFPFLLSNTFWLVCAMSVGLTLIREALKFWIPTYLVEVMHLSTHSAARWSALFPFVGGVSALLAGHLTDRFAHRGRGRVMVPALVLLSGALLSLAWLPRGGSLTAAIVCLSAIFFALMGPYTFLTGVMALDFGGKRGSSTAAGLVDSAGYLGSMVSLRYMGSLADSRGWGAAFLALAIVACLSTVAGTMYWLLDAINRRKRRRPAIEPLGGELAIESTSEETTRIG